MAAQRRRRRTTGRSSSSKGGGGLPGFVWMLIGLAIGLSVALAVYLAEDDGRPAAAESRAAATPARQPAKQPAKVIDSVDDNGEGDAEPPEQRFTFYEMLPSFEVVVADNEPRAVVEPGRYILQAGSFTRYEDADRRRAQLALQGIESTIQRAVINDTAYHRVRIGPIDDLDELNMLRSRLRRANIDVMRVRLEGE